MDLRWKASSRQQSTTSPPRRADTTSGVQGTQNFRFVQGNRRKKPRLPRGQTSAGLFAKFRLDVDLEASREEKLPSCASRALECDSGSQSGEETRASFEPPPSVFSDNDETRPSEIPQSEFPASDFDAQVTHVSSWQLHPYLQQPGSTPLHQYMDVFPSFHVQSSSLHGGVMFRSLAHKYSAMFSMFNEEFCVVPLTTDCLDNPFRAREDFAESYTFLSHAVMALTSHHLSKKKNSAILRRETHNHWSTALQLLSTALAHTGILPLLDTILLLINFESTQSAFGMLEMHLGGARRLLEQPGAMNTFAQSSRMRAQVAMLVWWDVTSALISRQPPRLAEPYLTLLQGSNESDSWSFLTLAGCPTEFLNAMARLATLAYDSEHESPKQGGILDQEVQTIIEEVRSYVHVFDIFDTQDPNESLNRHYCIECWRHAILLYALRVFNPTQTQGSLVSIQYHSRMILDSARCIPPTEPFQKQVLLPVFLAGAEADDEFNRSFVRQYCEHWSKVCSFDQFSGSLTLLEDIWEGYNVETRSTYWWGLRIGRGVRDTTRGDLRKELLLG